MTKMKMKMSWLDVLGEVFRLALCFGPSESFLGRSSSLRYRDLKGSTEIVHLLDRVKWCW